MSCTCGNYGYCDGCRIVTKKILVTGSCGFIFSNFMRKMMSVPKPVIGEDRVAYSFASIDKVLASYNLNNVRPNRDHAFYMGDIADEKFIDNVFHLEKPDIIIHGAAESFVDDSIRSASPFIHSNVVGTQVMVDLAVKHGVEKFIYISTDEVYGQLKPGDAAWNEASITLPRNPYSASKLAGELIVRAAGETHGLTYNITRCSNNYGPRQPPRNLVPKIITCIMNGEDIPIHGSGEQLREWLYVTDHNSAVMKVVEHGINKEIYNIGSGFELSNLEMVNRLSKYFNQPAKIKHVTDRPGHDFRYSVDCSKIKQLGWKPEVDFELGLSLTTKWYINNKDFYA